MGQYGGYLLNSTGKVHLATQSRNKIAYLFFASYAVADRLLEAVHATTAEEQAQLYLGIHRSSAMPSLEIF